MLREWGDGNGGYGAIVRRVLRDVRGSAVEVLRAIPSSNKRDSRLVVIPAVFVSGCQADALGFPITDRNLVAWSAATRFWYEIYY